MTITLSTHAARAIDASTNPMCWLSSSRIPGGWNELATGPGAISGECW
jgi:hypothetical protein